jgi:hypothetical protein
VPENAFFLQNFPLVAVDRGKNLKRKKGRSSYFFRKYGCEGKRVTPN